jgi:hypothetical protein
MKGESTIRNLETFSNGLIARGKIWRTSMQDMNFIKAKATAAAEFLADQGIEVKHTVLLEMLSRLEGFRNWSTYREQLADTPAVSNPPTLQQALTMCYRWMSSAPIDELEAVENALGENAPVVMAAEALTAAGTEPAKADVKPKTPLWVLGMEPMTDEQYLVHRGCRCPSCGSEDINASRVDSEKSVAWHNVKCEQCGAAWVDEFRRVGYSELEGGVDFELIASVVKDVKTRAEEYGFNVDSKEQARECVDESCDLLEPQMTEAERKIAVRHLTP